MNTETEFLAIVALKHEIKLDAISCTPEQKQSLDRRYADLASLLLERIYLSDVMLHNIER